MKNIVIFGACSAIAQATARLWAKDSASLVLIDRNEERLKVVADDLKTRGAKSVATIAADLTDMSNHQHLWQEINGKFKQQKAPDESLQPTTYNLQPNIVFIAYGTLSDQKKAEQDFNYAQQELTTNFLSVASLLTIIANHFEQANKASEAHTIAVISSVAGDRGRQSNYVYGTAKGALTVFLSGLRNRLAKKNVYVVTIKPGFVDTPMTADFKKGFLWVKPDVVARGIYRAVEKKKDIVYVPWFWQCIMLVIRLIPERIFKTMKL